MLALQGNAGAVFAWSCAYALLAGASNTQVWLVHEVGHVSVSVIGVMVHISVYGSLVGTCLGLWPSSSFLRFM